PWGRSCHSPAGIRVAAAQGAHWVTLSPYAASLSKPSARAHRCAEEYAGAPVPVIALGGITPDNAAEAVAAGADGVAVMGAVMRAADPAEVVRALREALR